MTKLGYPEYWWGAPARGHVAQFSPDREKFVVVLRRGDLENNTNEYSMLLWQTQDIFRSPASDVLLTMSSSSNRPAIQNVKWLPDNETVVFLGENVGEQSQLYALNVQTRTLRKLSESRDNILAYDVSPSGGYFAYVASSVAENLWDDKTRRTGVRISTQMIEDILAGKKGQSDKRLFFQAGNGTARLIHTRDRIDYGNGANDPLVSPDGKYIVLLLKALEFPPNWNGYSDPDLQRAIAEKRPPGRTTWVTRFELIDTSTGAGRPLLNVPQKSWDTEAAWSPDGHSILITNTYLPLDNESGEELQIRKSKKFTVEVSVPGGEITPVSQEDLKLISWSRKNELRFELGRRTEKEEPRDKLVFRKTGGKWKKVRNAFTPSRLEIVLEESMNSPPRIFAVDLQSHAHSLLLDLNPQFNQLHFGKVEEITWKGADGIEIKGGLYYPVDYEPGKRYPLVIQTHDWTPDRFWIDGPWTTAFAAQPLAGKGIMVLQGEKWGVDGDWWSKVADTPEETKKEVTTYERAISYLDEKGLIDRSRVGLIGFSRTCMYTKYALTQSTYHFAAASVTDGVDAGYFQYIAFSNASPGFAEEFEGINGGEPFGKGLPRWVELSPGFNIDKVHAPLLITALDPGSALGEWEWFAALTRLGKPVDMVMMNDGEHLLQKPWDRMISQQGTVDWFVFWLKGEEDMDPAKAEEYGRWRELRKLQAALDGDSGK
jgi:dipeptidyl aminopeptidase/acylaminoacyl peptidase